jgi:hypothetical protein
VADEVVGELADVVGQQHRVGQPLERVGAVLDDGGDEVVQPDRRADLRHTSTIG